MVEIADNLLQIPRFKAALEAGYKKSPRVIIRCSKGHRLVEVTVTAGVNGNPYLVATSEKPGDVVTDGWVSPDSELGRVEPPVSDPESVSRLRLKFECQEPGCHYAGVKTQGHLLAQYALAIQKGQRSIRLRD